jgi:hypothetical protein
VSDSAPHFSHVYTKLEDARMSMRYLPDLRSNYESVPCSIVDLDNAKGVMTYSLYEACDHSLSNIDTCDFAVIIKHTSNN